MAKKENVRMTTIALAKASAANSRAAKKKSKSAKNKESDPIPGVK